MSLRLSWREPCEAELDAQLRCQPHARGDAIVGRARALAVWKKLLRDRVLLARVVESSDTHGRRRVMGFGASVFVTPQFVESELASPRSELASRVIASVATRRSAVLTRAQIAEANAGTGLHAIFLAAVWWPTSSPTGFADMLSAAFSSCLDAHAGYRLRSFSVELAGDQVRALGSSSGFDVVGVFPNLDRCLVHTTRQGAAAAPLMAGNLLFQYREPRLGFRDADQRLLSAVLRGATDRELAAGIGVSLAAIKKRWQAIFGRIEERVPDLFAQVVRGDHGKRGAQKRHRLLSYLRDKPEELRPFKG